MFEFIVWYVGVLVHYLRWLTPQMPRVRTLLAVAATAVFLGGCAATAAFRDGTGGATGQQWHDPMLPGSEPATFVTSACPAINNNTEWAKCNEVKIWPAPPGQEAYSYVYKIKIRAVVGISYGEVPATAYVLGARDECMKQSEAHNWRKDGRVNEGNLRLSANPDERCAGPFYIRS